MTYYIKYDDSFKRVSVSETAMADPNDNAVSEVAAEHERALQDVPGPILVRLHNAASSKPVERFATKADAARRVWPLLAGLARKASAAAPEKAKRQRIGKEAKAPRAAAGKPTKPASEFVPVRAGTLRAKVVEALRRPLPFDQLAERVGTTPQNARAVVFCMWRDNGFGYSVDGGVISLMTPAGVDLIKEAKGAA